MKSNKELIETNRLAQKYLEMLINATPTGKRRNELTQENIDLLLKIKKLEKEEFHGLEVCLSVEYLKNNIGKIFASGTILHKGLHKEPVKWLAKVGDGFHDWAIYYGKEDWSWSEVKTNGNKITTDSIIKFFVPCSEEALKLYRK